MLLWRTLQSWVIFPHILVYMGCCLAVSVCGGSQASFKGGCPSSYFPPRPAPSIWQREVCVWNYSKYYLYSKLIFFFSFVPMLRTLYFFLKYFTSNFMCLSLLYFHLNIAKDLLLFSTNYSNSLDHTRYYCKILVRGKTTSSLWSCKVDLGFQTVQINLHHRLEICWITLLVGSGATHNGVGFGIANFSGGVSS